ncbi:flagellar basal-body MS-ring/collar protein FliF [Sinisalibacter aestuarii]|uniref:Flagellar M-ring protein n=1 Tax=Sinisalibacter aestuarii TaxID=2949426 RepID=A0ABQ5LNU0_9RHOB|nr:flagellar basal-body MS-ring/collar protein FliF [Sinisalibacter aestuarii]GKY86674.1 flagellar M-ring protein [Sinisalibacter aestuarii]
MQHILAVWAALDLRKRVIVIGATLAMFAAILALASVASRPSMALLYAGLEPGPAGEVISALEARGVVTEVRGGAIYVEAPRRDELRMTLAAEGLPGNSAKGYELLDTLSGFGTTAQMFDAAYWRAKEGELARTIVSSPLIQTARVHIAVPDAQAFRNRGQPTGSVMITPAGEALSAAHAKALKFLVASAVPGLAPEDVSVIDSRGGLIMAGDEAAAEADASDRAEALKRNIERLLEARVGYGNAVVELSLDTVTESEKILERVIDPEGRVAIATETEESAATASDRGGNAVTVASNLPDGDAGGFGDSSSNTTETRERINYELSETTREVNRAPGAIRRVSVAVLVDGIRGTDDSGAPVWQPRSDDELAALRDLVASAVGYDAARGDEITIKTMEFEPVAAAGAQASAGLLSALRLDAGALIRVAILAVTALVLGLFVLRPILSARPAGAAPAGALAPPDAAPPATSAPVLPALTGEIDDGTLPGGPEMAVVTSDFGFGGDESGLPALTGGDPVQRLRALIEERQAETVEILRGWMEDDAEKPA